MAEILDEKKSAINRDIGMNRALDNAERKEALWGDRALGYVKAYPEKEFMAEDVRVWAYKRGLAKPPHGRAWGIVMRKARALGIIRHKGFGSVKNPNAHRTPASIWGKA